MQIVLTEGIYIRISAEICKIVYILRGLPIGKPLTQIFPRKRKTKFKTFCAGACTWHKILIRLQVWNLFGMDEQIMRAADCRKLAEKPEGVFRQAQACQLASLFVYWNIWHIQ